MSCVTHSMGTFTDEYQETIEDRYNRCGLLNAIQHIDIYGKFRTSYVQPTKFKGKDPAVAISCISSSGPQSTHYGASKAVTDKISSFSVITRVSGLYPGHDILSKSARRSRLAAIREL